MTRVGKIVLGAALGAATLVAACGQKGPLYLPDAPDAKTTQAKETQDRQPKSAASETLTTPAIPTAPAPGVVQ